MLRTIPTVEINGQTFFVDERRRELRNAEKPQEVFKFRERWQDLEPGIDILGDNYRS